MKSVRRYIALTLTCLLVFSSIRYLLFNQLVQIRKEVFRHNTLLAPKEEIKQLRISASKLYQNNGNLQWADNNKELIIGNTFYEILSITKTGDAFLVCMIEDEEENSTYTHFFDLVKSNQKLADYLLLVLNVHYNLPDSYAFTPPASFEQTFHQDATKAVLCGHLFKIIKPPLTPSFS